MDIREDVNLEELGLVGSEAEPQQGGVTRRSVIKGFGACALAVAGSSALFGCGSNNAASDDKKEEEAAALDYSDWDAVVEAAKGTTVTYCGYSGNEQLDSWITDDLTPALKEKYDITLNYMRDGDISTLILDAVSANAAEDSGTFDVGWINGNSFADPMRVGGYFGPITDKLPNFEKYIDKDDVLTNYDFTFPIEGYEAPFGRYQVNIVKDDGVAPEDISTVEAFADFCKKYPGKVAYMSSEFYLGAAFIRAIIYNICGWEQFQTMEADYDTVHEAVEPAMEYLRGLNPYLWQEGKTFPADAVALTEMYKNGESLINIIYDQYGCGTDIVDGNYPETSRSYLFEKGTPANESYWGVPFNAPNKAGALVVINEMLDPEQQLLKCEKSAGYVTDLSKVDADMKKRFEAVDHGPNNCTDEELLEKALPEYSADIEKIVTEIWLKEVVGK